MSQNVSLIVTSRTTPAGPSDGDVPVAYAACIPIGFLALFSPSHVRTIESASARNLTLFAPKGAAVEAIRRRAAVLAEPVARAFEELAVAQAARGQTGGACPEPWEVAHLLESLAAQVERAPGSHVQAHLHDAYFPWSAERARVLEALLGAATGDGEGWRCFLDFSELGNATTRPWSREEAHDVVSGFIDRSPDSIEAAAEPTHAWDEVGPLWPIDLVGFWGPAPADDIHRLVEDAGEDLARRLPELPLEVRRAVGAYFFSEGLLAPAYPEIDPDLALHHLLSKMDSLQPDAEVVAAALGHADPRPRIILARTYGFDLPVLASSARPPRQGARRAAEDDVWRALVVDPSPQVRAEVAANPCAPLAPGLDERHPLVRAACVLPGWREHAELARHPHEAVRREVAANARAARAALQALVDDPEPAVRAELAANPSTPVDALERLANDVDPHVRRAVADKAARVASHRPAAEAEARRQIVARLADDPDARVARAAAHALRRLRRLEAR